MKDYAEFLKRFIGTKGILCDGPGLQALTFIGSRSNKGNDYIDEVHESFVIVNSVGEMNCIPLNVFVFKM